MASEGQSQEKTVHQKSKPVSKRGILGDTTYQGKICVKKTDPSLMLNGSAKNIIDQILCALTREFCNNVELAGKKTIKKTISPEFCMTAVKLCCLGCPVIEEEINNKIEMVKEKLAEIGLKKAEKKIRKENEGDSVDENSDDDDDDEEKTKTTRRETKVGLYISVSGSTNILKEYTSFERISELSPFILSCFIEVFLDNLFLGAVYEVKRELKKKVMPRHVFISIEDDKELKRMVSNNGIIICGCGSPKYIPEIPKKPRKARNVNSDKKKKNPPGMTALEDIRKLQKNCDPITADAPIERIIKQHFKNEKGEAIKSCSKDSTAIIKAYMERVVGMLFTDTRETATSRNIQTVNGALVEEIWKIKYVREFNVPYIPPPSSNHKDEDGKEYKDIAKDYRIPVAQIKSLAKRSGILRVGSGMDVINRFINSLCYSICAKINALFITLKGKTVLVRNVDAALEYDHIYVCVNPEVLPKTKKAVNKNEEEEEATS